MREKRIALAVCLVLLLISSVWLIRFPVPASALDSQVLTVKKAEKLMKSLTPVEGEERLLTGLYFADGELPCDVESLDLVHSGGHGQFRLGERKLHRSGRR